ncbi:hypothetical protein JCM6882_000276 [Rhodosporidiobolus microsporus]
MAEVALPAVAASPFRLEVAAAFAPAPAAAALGPTSVAMENGASSGSGSSRSSGGETVAGARDEEEEEQDEAAMARDRTDSLAKLEGRPLPTTPKMLQSASLPASPRAGGSPAVSAGRRSAEFMRDAIPRARLNGSPRTSGRNSRASLATLDSLLTTGESVYEDATEGDTEEDWEDEPNLPHSISNLTKSPILPDTPPSEEELASASSDVRKTPKAGSPSTPPQSSYPEFVDSQHLTPSSSFEEQAILLQRRATLQAEASRRIAIRQSVSALPSSSSSTSSAAADSPSTVLALRRFSAAPRQSPAAAHSDPQRASISGPSPSAAALLAASPPRQWHPKPLVLTPARTINTPLTSSASSPSRRRESLGVGSSSGGGHSRTHSNVSNFSSWSGGSRPLSPRGEGRISPYMTMTLGRAGSLAGPSSSSSSPPPAAATTLAARRRSTGYVESAGDLAMPRGERHHRKSLSATTSGRISWMGGGHHGGGAPLPQLQHRNRSTSEDTGASHLTGESTTTRYASSSASTRSARGERESPDSSAGGWSDEKEEQERERVKHHQRAGEGEGDGVEGSPSMNDQEWEQEYFRRTGASAGAATPLESVQEGESGTGSDTPATTVQPRFSSPRPSPRPAQYEQYEQQQRDERAEYVEFEASPRTAEEARSIGLVPTTQAPVVAQVGEEAMEQPSELPPPVAFLEPRRPSQQQAVKTPSSPPLPPKEPHLSSPRQPYLGSPRQPHLSSPRQPAPLSPRQSAPISPRQPAPAPHPSSPSTPARRRPSARYDELWNGEPSFDSGTSAASDSDVSLALATPPRGNSFEASSSRPPSQLNPANSNPNLASPARSTGSLSDATRSTTPRKGKPIVIKSVTARSSAANARRSHRLSQVEPPLLEAGGAPHNRLSTRIEGPAAHHRLSTRLEGPAAHHRLSTRLGGGDGGAAHRLSARLSKRLSITPGSPKEHSPPTVPPSQVPTPQGARSPPQCQLSPPREATPQRNSVVASGLAIWPPPAETKTVTLGAPLAYHTDSEMSSTTSLGDASDDEDLPPTAAERAAERERARLGNSTSPRSSGYSFPNTTRRKPAFEPRDPRGKRDDFETGDSFLEVLLNSEPPASMNLNRRHYLDDDDKRWSNYSSGTVDTFRKGSAGSFASGTSGATLQGPFDRKSSSGGGGITKKLFGGLKTLSPGTSSSDDRKRPISIAPGGTARRSGSNKPRPVVSAPLELQAASHAMLAGQRSLSSMSGSSHGSSQGSQYWGSAQSSPNQPQSSIALGAALASRYTNAAAVASAGGNDDAAEELASTYGDGASLAGGRPSLDSVYRPPPKAYALPPGLLSAGDAPPPPPHRPIRPSASPAPSQRSGLSPSPAQSFTSVLNSPFQMRSRQGSKDSSAAGSFVSANAPAHAAAGSASPLYPRKGSAGSSTQAGTGFDFGATSPTLTREVLRGQFLER